MPKSAVFLYKKDDRESYINYNRDDSPSVGSYDPFVAQDLGGKAQLQFGRLSNNYSLRDLKRQVSNSSLSQSNVSA